MSEETYLFYRIKLLENIILEQDNLMKKSQKQIEFSDSKIDEVIKLIDESKEKTSLVLKASNKIWYHGFFLGALTVSVIYTIISICRCF